MKRSAGFLCLWMDPVLAHVLDEPVEHLPWNLSPVIVVPLAAALVLFVAGAARLRKASGGRRSVKRQDLCFLTGWSMLAVAAISPLHAAGSRSFALHMLEHELLMLAAAPLIVLGRPLPVFLWTFGRPSRLVIGRFLRHPRMVLAWDALSQLLPSTLLQAAILWVWHIPALFEAALARESWHIAQHLSFFLSALLFWNAVFRSTRRAGMAAICLFLTSLVTGALGALMAFSSSPWYPRYAMLGLNPFGLSPVEDQQLAGLLMWIPGGLVHAAAAMILIARTMHAPVHCNGKPPAMPDLASR